MAVLQAVPKSRQDSQALSTFGQCEVIGVHKNRDVLFVPAGLFSLSAPFNSPGSGTYRAGSA